MRSFYNISRVIFFSIFFSVFVDMTNVFRNERSINDCFEMIRLLIENGIDLNQQVIPFF